jgi:uncharacterized protein (TIRG00374 family)
MALSRYQIIQIGLGIIVFTILIFFAGAEALSALSTASPVHLILVFVIVACLTALSARRWGDLTNSFVGHQVCSFFDYYHTFILSRATGLIIPQSASELGLRPILHRLSTQSSGLSAFNAGLIERFFDGTLLLATGIPSFIFIIGLIGSKLYVILLLSFIFFWLLGLTAFTRSSIAYLSKLTSRITETRSAQNNYLSRLFITKLNQTIDPLSKSVARDNSTIKWVGFLSIVRYLLISLQFLLIARALGLTGIGVIDMFAALPAAQLSLLIAITPGGIGFVEGGFLGVFIALGIPLNEINAFLVGQRIITGVFIFLLAFLSHISTSILMWRNSRNRIN